MRFQANWRFRRIEPADVDPGLAGAADWRRLCAVPVRLNSDGTRAVAVADPEDVRVLDAIRRALGHDVEVFVAPPEDIELALGSLQVISGETFDGEGPEAAEELREKANEAPIVNLVNTIISGAIARGASDIHVEPDGESARVMVRVDGVKLPFMRIGRADLLGVVSRVKVMAGMDIAERRLPQDGRIRVRGHDGDEIDVRVSTLPSKDGEAVCLRLLRKTPEVLDLESLGMPERDYEILSGAIRAGWGMILASGPTGSGKSTTLFLCLKKIARPEIEILTVEDPVEYRVPFAHQLQVNEKAGLGFAEALRAFLRHDPDVIMVGEIRDRETAEIATRAALTGHLVFSTVHTNDAASVPLRLVDMGVEPFMAAASLSVVVAQRLVRKTCAACRTQVEVPRSLVAVLDGIAPRVQFAGTGCPECGGTGYRGRIAVFEVMRVTPEIRRLIKAGADADAIREAARSDGMTTLLEDGMRRVREGVTTVQEVLRVTASAEGPQGGRMSPGAVP